MDNNSLNSNVASNNVAYPTAQNPDQGDDPYSGRQLAHEHTGGSAAGEQTLGQPDRRGGMWRKTAAIGLTVVLAAGAFAFTQTFTGAEPQSMSLTSPGDEDLAPEPNRTSGVSRTVDRFPLEGGEDRSFSVTVDGETVELNSNAATLAAALSEAGIEVGLLDHVSAPMGEPPAGEVTIERVTETFETTEEKIPFTTKTKKTSQLIKGTEKVQTKGKAGARTTTKRVFAKDGEITHEEILAEAVGSQPVNEVILVGTAPKPQKPVVASGSSSGSSSSSSGSSSSSSGSSGSSSGSSSSSSGSSSSSSAPAQSYSGESPRGIAQKMLPSYGWGGDQWSCLNQLWYKESGWNHTSMNPSSGAYGIPQSLPGSKMAKAGADWRTNPATQIKWGLGYIKGRYGTPCGAWGHFQAKNWY